MKSLDLRAILHHIPWAIIGGVATRAYMSERSTLDLDVLVHTRDANNVNHALRSGGCLFQQELAIGGSAWKSPESLTLDVVEREDQWADEAITNTQRDPQRLPVVRLPY